MLKQIVDKLKQEIFGLEFIKDPRYNFSLKEHGLFHGFTFEVNERARRFGEHIQERAKPRNANIIFEKLSQEYEGHRAKVYALSIQPYGHLKRSELEVLLIEAINSIVHEVRNYKQKK